MHARWTWLAGSVRERETHARSDSSFSENDTSITRRGAAITISPSANPPKGDMDIVKPKRNPPRCVRIHGIDTLVVAGHAVIAESIAEPQSPTSLTRLLRDPLGFVWKY